MSFKWQKGHQYDPCFCQAKGVFVCIHVVIYENMAIHDTWTWEKPLHISAIPLADSIFALAFISQWDPVAAVRKYIALPRVTDLSLNRKAYRCSDAQRSLRCICLIHVQYPLASEPLRISISMLCGLRRRSRGKMIQKSRGLCNKAHFSFQHRRGKN